MFGGWNEHGMMGIFFGTTNYNMGDYMDYVYIRISYMVYVYNI